MEATNGALAHLVKAASYTGFLVIDDDVLHCMQKAAELAEQPARPPRRVNKEAQRHISFLLRQWGIERL